MRTLTVNRSSVFPAGKREVFSRLTKLETLQEVAWPYATFTPVSESDSGVWAPGATTSYKFKLFGFIPFGTHTIHVIRFGEGEGIYTHEGNEHVPVWNHEITLRELSADSCKYADIVEIGAGWKTPLIWVWACAFYRHRQRKWIRILSGEKDQGGGRPKGIRA